MAGATFGDAGASLLVEGATYGDAGVSLFVAGAAFGDVGVSLFVAGAVFGEIWRDSRGAECCNLRHKCVAEGGEVTSANGRVQFCNFMLGSGLARVRILAESAAHCILQRFSANLSEILDCNFAWQAQYLVRLEGLRAL